MILNYYNYTTHQNMQGIQHLHEVHIGSTCKGYQILGQQTSSKARYSMATILWLRPWAQPALPWGYEGIPISTTAEASTDMFACLCAGIK
jgi:hypothetical protein